MADVLCIGMACTDVVLRGVDHNRAMADYEHGVPVAGVSMAGGGDALNEAIVLGYLGHDVKLYAGCGDDGAGLLIKALAEKAGVDTSLCASVPGYATPISVMCLDEDVNARFFRPVPQADGSFLTRVRFVPRVEDIHCVRVVSLASLFTAPLDDVNLVVRLAKRAKREGAIVCADTKPLRRDMTILDYADALPYIDYIFPNEVEAAMYAGGGNMDLGEAAQNIRALGVKNVLIKQAERGVSFYGEDESFHTPAFSAKAVDSTGCGDNFAAGFISGLLQGMDARGCCAFASAAASICVESVGASTGVISRDQVVQRLNQGHNKRTK